MFLSNPFRTSKTFFERQQGKAHLAGSSGRGLLGNKIVALSGRFSYILASRGPVVHIGVTANILVKTQTHPEPTPSYTPKAFSSHFLDQ